MLVSMPDVVILEADDSDAAEALLHKHHPHLVIVDGDLCGNHRMELIETAFAERPRVRCFILVNDVYQQAAAMRFMDGSTLLRHSFIKMGFLSDWISVLEPGGRNEKEEVFTCLEKNLNDYAETHGELALTIPMVYIFATWGWATCSSGGLTSRNM